jgi:hypothetical protein
MDEHFWSEADLGYGCGCVSLPSNSADSYHHRIIEHAVSYGGDGDAELPWFHVLGLIYYQEPILSKDHLGAPYESADFIS